MAATVGDRFERLVEIMRTLRSPDGCPWDREQTHASLRPFVLEETYEIRLRGKNRIVTLVPDQKERLCFKAGNGEKVAVTEKQIVRQVERCAECWLVEVKRPGTYCSQCVPVRARKALVFVLLATTT